MVNLIQHREHIVNIIRHTFSSMHIPQDDIDDAYQSACLAALNTLNTQPQEDLLVVMSRIALRYIGCEVSIQSRMVSTDICDMDRIQDEGYDAYIDKIQYNRTQSRHIDYNKLDQRYRNQLTPIRKQLWDLRIDHTPPQQIYKLLNRNPVWISVTEHEMIKRYKYWFPIITQLTSIPIENFSNIDHEIVRLFCNGHTTLSISKMIGTVSSQHVSSRIMRIRLKYFPVISD